MAAMNERISSSARRAWLRAAASLIAFAASAKARSQAPVPATRKVLVFGDSLSAGYGLRRGYGWVDLLAQRLDDEGRPWHVVNASVSGETTAGGRARAPILFERERPAIVVVELGANDALRGLDLGAAQANLRDILHHARAVGARCLLVGMRMPPNYGRAYAEEFERMFRRVATSEKAPLVPFLLEGLADRPDLFLADRIHPSERAQPTLLENVWTALKPMLK
jgi:acyl-CoA thioesterase I